MTKIASTAAALALALTIGCSQGTSSATAAATPAAQATTTAQAATATPAPESPSVANLDVAYVDSDGLLVAELFNEFRSMPLMVRFDMKTEGAGTANIVVRQAPSNKEVAKKTIKLFGGAQRALVMFSKRFETCFDVMVDVTVTEKGKSATSSALVSATCGE